MGTDAETPGSSRLELQLGQVLVERGFISSEQLTQAKEQALKEGKRLARVLHERRSVNKDILATVLSFHLKVPVVDPWQVKASKDAIQLIPKETAQEYMVLPLSIDQDGTLRVLMKDPGDFGTINYLANLTGRLIRPVLPLDLGEGLKELIVRSYAI